MESNGAAKTGKSSEYRIGMTHEVNPASSPVRVISEAILTAPHPHRLHCIHAIAQ
ncbi:MAG: hypothetical protein WCP41_03215 [Verrucomicrobiota bacterium]